ncbi:7c9b8eca-8d35-4c7d-8f0a-0e4f35beb93c [Sclerotinia trifoliorum]|uniref:7c9b8eca-8d35-4c7d-8f0a-0e4f35beb93c n=1 Tax=Sclerotinia trifoliorum TaxID=28548 RepID=A0A8H2VWU3_9HELO|nr:7c9b8eca-8d35-4c7d-8f0a-0e4f35beb93c [Sclerotinia trifoliorum]
MASNVTNPMQSEQCLKHGNFMHSTLKRQNFTLQFPETFVKTSSPRVKRNIAAPKFGASTSPPYVSSSRSSVQSSKPSPHPLSVSVINWKWLSSICHAEHYCRWGVQLPFLVLCWLNCGRVWERSRFRSMPHSEIPLVNRTIAFLSAGLAPVLMRTLNVGWAPPSIESFFRFNALNFNLADVAIGTPGLIIAWLGVAFEYLFKAWLSEDTIKSFETFVDGVIDSSRLSNIETIFNIESIWSIHIFWNIQTIQTSKAFKFNPLFRTIGHTALKQPTTHKLTPTSQSETSPETETGTSSIPGAELLGFTIDNRPIISFNKLSPALHPSARHFATTEDGRSIYIYGGLPTDSTDDSTDDSADNDRDSAVGRSNVSESGRTSRNGFQGSDSLDSTLGRSLTLGNLASGRFGSDEAVSG